MLTPTYCATCQRTDCALIPTAVGAYICLPCLDRRTDGQGLLAGTHPQTPNIPSHSVITSPNHRTST